MGTSLLSPRDCLSSPRGRQIRTFPTISCPPTTGRTSAPGAFGPTISEICYRHGGSPTLHSPVRQTANLHASRGLVDIKDPSLCLRPVRSQYQHPSSSSQALHADFPLHDISSQSSPSQNMQLSSKPLQVLKSHSSRFSPVLSCSSSCSQTSNSQSSSMLQKTKGISGDLSNDFGLKVLSWFPECDLPDKASNDSVICDSKSLPHRSDNVATKFHYKATKKAQPSKHGGPSPEGNGRKYLNSRTPCQYQRKRTHPEPPQVSESDIDEVDPVYNVLKPCNRNGIVLKAEKDAYRKKEHRHGLVRVKSDAVLIDRRRNACQDSERWAGPSYFNSPPPSSLPLPTFANMPKASQKPMSNVHLIPVQRTGSPDSCNDSVENDADSATKFLKKLLNLESASL